MCKDCDDANEYDRKHPGWEWRSRTERNYSTTSTDPLCAVRTETPCGYCGQWAPIDVHQCLGCGAPR